MPAGMELAGQSLDLAGFPGAISAPNLTPDPETGAANWTDDQIARAIREGIKHDDTTLFPMMPYPLYRNLSDEDLASVVVYLRSLPPVRNSLAPTKVNFPINFTWCAAFPSPSPNRFDPQTRPPGAPKEYLVTLGAGR
jgi:hypothetical protein